MASPVVFFLCLPRCRPEAQLTTGVLACVRASSDVFFWVGLIVTGCMAVVYAGWLLFQVVSERIVGCSSNVNEQQVVLSKTIPDLVDLPRSRVRARLRLYWSL